MEFKRGLVVRSLKGHDKGGFFVVLECDLKLALICDGKRRTLEKPKKKKLMHLAATNTAADEEILGTNRKIRKLLSAFNADNRKTDAPKESEP